MPEIGDDDVYDFYNHQPSSLADIKEYLRTWFRRCDNGGSLYWGGTQYTLALGFRRGFCSHEVFVDTRTHTNHFIFTVDGNLPPLVSGDFIIFDDVVDQIATFYAKAWKIA